MSFESEPKSKGGDEGIIELKQVSAEEAGGWIEKAQKVMADLNIKTAEDFREAVKGLIERNVDETAVISPEDVETAKNLIIYNELPKDEDNEPGWSLSDDEDKALRSIVARVEN